MVCVFTSFLLVAFIIAVRRGKVNSLKGSFTICLQNGQICENPFTKRSKSSSDFRVDKAGAVCYYLAC